MTTNNHTPITTGAAANASTFNTPLGSLDAAIGDETTLTTSAKSSVVAAINELDANKLESGSSATLIANTPSGNISSVTVQAAINELDTEKQPLDSDLTAIAGISATNDDVIQRKSGVWTNRSMAQVKTDLAITATDVANVAAGNISSVTVQAAINELDTEKAALSHTHTVSAISDQSNWQLDDFGTPDDNTDLDASTSRHGLLPKLANDAMKVLSAVGTWIKLASGIKVNGALTTARGYLDLRGAAGVLTYYDDSANDAVRITIAGGSGGSSALTELTDVSISGEADLDILSYNASTVVWENRLQSEFKLDNFGTPDDNTDLNATTSRHGLLPKLSGSSSDVLKGDGSFGTASGGGHTIQDEGTNLTNRATLNFVGGGVLAADNSTYGRTDVTALTKYPCQGRLTLKSGYPYYNDGSAIAVVTASSSTADTLTVTAGHGFVTGQMVLYQATAGKGPTAGTVYYANVSSNTIKLYTTLAGAIAGGATAIVDITANDIAGNLFNYGIASTTVYFSPLHGNTIALYTGIAWKEYNFTELTLDISTYTASKPYDIFVHDNSGTLTLEGLVWTDATNRATALTTQEGVLVKTGATTRRYIGTIYVDAAGGETIDGPTRRYVWNMYNRGQRRLWKIEPTNNWVYGTATWRQVLANALNKVEIVVGWKDAKLALQSAFCFSSQYAGSNYALSGIAKDATNTNHADVCYLTVFISNSSLIGPNWSTYEDYPLGYHYYAWTETTGGQQCTIYGQEDPSRRAGIVGYVEG